MKKILIIGATSAIAEQCARIWAGRGDELYLVARDKERLTTMSADLKLRGAFNVSAYCADVSEVDKHNELLNVAEKVMNHIDVSLIAHGTLPDQKACESDVGRTLVEIKANALSTVSLLTLIADRFEQKGSGSICVISSVAGERGRASNYIYGSAKAMITVFASGLRQRLHKSNVSVITIKPGLVDTPMTSGFKKGPLWARPNIVAEKIVKAIDKNAPEVYAPGFWKVVMFIIKLIPNKIFRLISL